MRLSYSIAASISALGVAVLCYLEADTVLIFGNGAIALLWTVMFLLTDKDDDI